MVELKTALEIWRKAEAAARASEQRLATATRAYDGNPRAAVSPELMREVVDLRGCANERLTLALSLIRKKGAPSEDQTITPRMAV